MSWCKDPEIELNIYRCSTVLCFAVLHAFLIICFLKLGLMILLAQLLWTALVMLHVQHQQEGLEIKWLAE